MMEEPRFLTKDGLLVAEGYNRIVSTDDGDEYYEFEDCHIKSDNIYIPVDAKWRLVHDQAFYMEYRSRCTQLVKFYHQLRTVNYADYRIGSWYVSVYDVIMEHNGQRIERKRLNKVTDYL